MQVSSQQCHHSVRGRSVLAVLCLSASLGIAILLAIAVLAPRRASLWTLSAALLVLFLLFVATLLAFVIVARTASGRTFAVNCVIAATLIVVCSFLLYIIGNIRGQYL